jgi:hypothetical protein
MRLSRARFTPIVAMLLSFALTAQIAGAQVATCAAMSGAIVKAAADSSAHRHQHASMGSSSANKVDKHPLQKSPVSQSCTPASPCLNTPAIPTTALQSVDVKRAMPVIALHASCADDRASQPNPPPPKL